MHCHPVECHGASPGPAVLDAVDGAVQLSRAPIRRSLDGMGADGRLLTRDGRCASAHLSHVPEIGVAPLVRARVAVDHELEDLTNCAQREVLAVDTTSAHRGASRGAKNSGNQRRMTTGPGSSHPSGVAQWQRVTINGNERRATYKQEVRGSSPRPPMQEEPATSRFAAAWRRCPKLCEGPECESGVK
jgi:hypothetical protein